MKIFPKQWERYQKRLVKFGFRNYSEYLLSNRWKLTRERYRNGVKQWSCWVCGKVDSLQIHHRSYFHLGDEPIKDLVVLCRPHHKAVHDYLDLYNLSVFFTSEALREIKESYEVTHPGI